MSPLVALAELSAIESSSVFVMLCAVLFVYYHYPQVLAGGRGVPLTGPLNEFTLLQHASGLDSVVCPHCGVENSSAYTYCSNCVAKLWRQ